MNGIFCSWIFVPIYGNFSTDDDDDDDDDDEDEEYESLDLWHKWLTAVYTRF